MAYSLKPGKPLAAAMQQEVTAQFALAIAALQGVAAGTDDSAHDARRHVKKLRALVRLIQPSCGGWSRRADRRLRAINRLLAPRADAEAAAETFARIRERYPHGLAPDTFVSINAGLVYRARLADRKATFDRAAERAARLLQAEARRAGRWRMPRGGFAAIAAGLEQSARRARRAGRRALGRPSGEHSHHWRACVKNLWLQIRLIEARCDGRLAADQVRLEQLTAALGEYHNTVLLAGAIAGAPLESRHRTAQCLRLIREYQRHLRCEIAGLASADEESPRQFVRRVRQLWRAAAPARATAAPGTPWSHAA